MGLPQGDTTTALTKTDKAPQVVVIAFGLPEQLTKAELTQFVDMPHGMIRPSVGKSAMCRIEKARFEKS